MTHRTERRQTSIFQLEFAHALKKLDVLWIRGRKTALDIINTERIKALHNAQLILNGKGNPFALLAIAQRAVVCVDFRFLKCLFACRHSHSTWEFFRFFADVRAKSPSLCPSERTRLTWKGTMRTHPRTQERLLYSITR